MKWITAIIQPHRLEAVKQCLTEVEVFRLTVSDVQGYGRQKGHTEYFRGQPMQVNLIRTLQHTTRALHDPLLQSPHGRIAIVSSTGLANPRATNAAYLTAKAGAEMWLLAVADSFKESNAAATIGRIMALVTPQMQDEKPDGYKKFTPVAKIADWLVGLYDRPAAEVNGLIETITR